MGISLFLSSNVRGSCSLFSLLLVLNEGAALAADSGQSPLNFSQTTGILSIDTIPVSKGGTGSSTFSNYGLIFNNTASSTPFFSSAIPGSAGNVFMSNGTTQAPSFQPLSPPSWTMSTKNSSFTILSSQKNTLFLVSGTTGTTTATLPTASAAGSGFQIIIKKLDNGPKPLLTIARSGADLIDGATSYSFSQVNETVILMSDGTSWHALKKYTPFNGGGIAPGTVPDCTSTTQVPNWNFLCDGTAGTDKTFTVPAGVTALFVSMWGGGGGGYNYSGGCPGGYGGGGGAYTEGIISTTPGSVLYYTIGAAGATGVTLSNGVTSNSGNGGQTCIGMGSPACTSPTASAYGGYGGASGGGGGGGPSQIISGFLSYSGGSGNRGGGAGAGNTGNGASSSGYTGATGNGGTLPSPSYREGGAGGDNPTSACYGYPAGAGGFPAGGGGGTVYGYPNYVTVAGTGGTGAITIQW